MPGSSTGRASALGAAYTWPGFYRTAERKSIEPISRRVALPEVLAGTQDPDPGLQQFVSQSSWDEGAVARRYRALLAESFADPAGVFVLGDTTFPKAGSHSVGVQRQYGGALGKKANCQAAVSLHDVGRHGHVPLVLRLFLPERWLEAPARLDKAGVPEDRRRVLSKGEIALELLDAVSAEGVLPGQVVVGDSGYGVSGPLRAGLAARGLLYVLGVTGEMLVFTERPRWQAPGPSRRARPRVHHHLEPDSPWPLSLRQVAAQTPLRKVTWRVGTKGPMAGRFAWVRVWSAHGWATGDCACEESVWLLIEEAADGTIKYAFSKLPAGTSRIKAVRLWRERWKIEQGYQQMKEELGLRPLRGPKLARLPPPRHPRPARLRLPGARTAPRQAEATTKKRPSVSRSGLITLPAIRRGLQQLLAPVAKPDCPYCRLHLLSNQLTE